MRRITTALATAIAAASAVLAPTAAASGPAPHGKEIQQIECTGLGMLTVAVPRPEASKGAGQLVGEKGHGIPVVLSFAATDVTKGTVVFSESRSTGNGHGHPHQATTKCTATFFEGPASVFFEGHEPPGVEPTDIIRASFEVQVIIKK